MGRRPLQWHVFNGTCIEPEAVAANLDAALDPITQVLDEVYRVLAVALTDVVAGNELGIGFDGNVGPHVTDLRLVFALPYVTLLLADEAPDDNGF